MRRLIVAIAVIALLIVALYTLEHVHGCGRSSLTVTVVNPFNASWRLEIRGFGWCRVFESSAKSFTYVIENGSAVQCIDFSYRLGDTVVSYSVVPESTNRVFLLVFPPWLSNVSTPVVHSYSWCCYPWRGAPWGLEIMVGTDSSYVEESIAGRIFVLFYDWPYHRVEDLLDRLGIEDPSTRYEIAATALWAAQLVREAKQSPIYLGLCIEATRAILEKYFGIPSPLATVLAYAAIPLYIVPKIVDRDELYRAVLYAIKSVHRYVEVFPQWKRVDYSTWIEMCRRLESYTVALEVPTYAPALVGGAYALYELHTLVNALLSAVKILGANW